MCEHSREEGIIRCMDVQLKRLQEENARLKDGGLIHYLRFTVANELGHPDDIIMIERWLKTAEGKEMDYGKNMDKEKVKATIADLEDAMETAKEAGFDSHFISELDHLLATARANMPDK